MWRSSRESQDLKRKRSRFHSWSVYKFWINLFTKELNTAQNVLMLNVAKVHVRHEIVRSCQADSSFNLLGYCIRRACYRNFVCKYVVWVIKQRDVKRTVAIPFLCIRLHRRLEKEPFVFPVIHKCRSYLSYSLLVRPCNKKVPDQAHFRRSIFNSEVSPVIVKSHPYPIVCVEDPGCVKTMFANPLHSF